MNMTPYVIIAAVICVVALVATIMIGVNPKDDQYEKKSKKHFINISIIYAATFVPALIFTVLYFFYF